MESQIRELIERALGGDEHALRELWERVEAVLGDDVRSRSLVRDVMDVLRADAMGRLRLFAAMHAEIPSIEFAAWIRVLARSVVRKQPARGDSETIASAIIMRRAASQLREPELSALELWTENADYVDIARELELHDGAEGARRIVRSALERLREGTR